jgi:uncharacterized repeat protein (TIGR01451 family)
MPRRPFGPKSPATRDRRARRAGPALEALEGRQLLAIFQVTSVADTDTGDDTSGTLRHVIGLVNAASGTSTVNFQLSDSDKADGVWTIRPETPLPAITASVFLNGLVGNSVKPLVVLDGSLLTTGTPDGLDLTGSANSSTIVGLDVIHFAGAGISVNGLSNVTVRQSYLGVGPDGATAAPNGVGVLFTNVQSGTVGGTSTNTGNLISGNTSAGIRIVGPNSQANNVQGNIVGLNADGSGAVPNGVGIEIAGTGGGDGGAHDNIIGGTATTARNTISGNAGAGIRILDTGASNNQVQNNYIGTGFSGTTAFPNAEGVYIGPGAVNNSVGGLSTTLRNIISGNSDYGIEINGAQGTLVAGNYIGTKADGTAAVNGGGQGRAGVLVRDGALSTTIGGTSTIASNLISGNGGPGVWVRGRTGGTGAFTSGTVIDGNQIGTDSTGTLAVGNVQGVALTDGPLATTIGGTVSTAANLISGNSSDGILLASTNTSGVVVEGNIIGLAKDKATPLANAGNGVRIDGASNNQIGGTLLGAANTIASNGGAGVWVQSGNGNTIRRNVIQNNGGLGIDLGAQGVTPNDSGSTANDGQNFPVISSVSTTNGTTRISGSLHAKPNQTYIIEFYSDPSPDPSGHGEGPTFLGTSTVTTGTDGNATFSTTASSAVPTGTAVTATATAQNSSGVATSTSEFAANVTSSVPQADLALTQSASTPSTTQPNTVASGGYITYTLVVTNNGPATAGGVVVTDTLPAGVSFLSATATTGTIGQSTSGNTVTFTLGDLASGAAATMTITGVAPSTVPSPATITNTAVASQSTSATDPNDDNNTSTLTSNVLQGVDLSLTQVALPNPVSVGTETAFVLTLTNSGTSQAHDVVVTDTLPAGFVYTRSETTQGTVAAANGQVVINLGTLPPVSTTGSGFSARVVLFGIPTQAGGLTNTTTATAQEPLILPGSTNTSLTLAAVPPLTSAALAAPHVLNVVRLGSGGLTRQVVIGFDQPMNAVTATAFSNYVVGSLGRDGRFGTKDDALLGFLPPRYDADAQTVTLTLSRPVQSRMTLGLAVNGLPPSGVLSSNGVLLDGNYDGVPGGNYANFIAGEASTRAARAVGPGMASAASAKVRARSVPQGPHASRRAPVRGQ